MLPAFTPASVLPVLEGILMSCERRRCLVYVFVWPLLSLSLSLYLSFLCLRMVLALGRMDLFSF